MKQPEHDMELFSPSGERVLTVSELTRRIRNCIEGNFPVVWVAGEVSNFSRPSSGHIYFTLKDQKAQISCVMWRSMAAKVKFRIEDGLSLIVRGNLTVYEARGQYQIVAHRAEPLGIGALQLAFEQLKEKLDKEGLFDERFKKPLPFMPQKIGVVTSPTGAAIKDIIRTITHRFDRVSILLYPVRVQGEAAKEEIVQAIEELNRRGDIDVMIVGRGGGSLEDLWAFNEEIVARAIFASKVPIISAVGHEIDITISDLVADLRALTPTDAGQKVVPQLNDILMDLDNKRNLLVRGLLEKVRAARQHLDALAKSYGFRQLLDNIRQKQQHLDEMILRMRSMLTGTLSTHRERLDGLGGKLDSLSPLNVLQRGFSITTLADNGKPLKSTKGLAPGKKARTRLADGQFDSVVEEMS